MKLTLAELEARRTAFCQNMEGTDPAWDTAIIVSKVNQYYFTGSMQVATLLIKKDGSYAYFVRNSYERAKDESPLEHIYPLGSYRGIAEQLGESMGNTYIEADIMPFGMLGAMQKYLKMDSVKGCDRVIRNLRAVKSEYELYWMRESGKRHAIMKYEKNPAMLREGMTEQQMQGELLRNMMELGFQGICRFNMFDNEMGVGQFSFGTNSLYPTFFDGPAGSMGNSPGVPVGGDPNKKLRIGDLVFIDAGFGMQGYHTDTTQVYMYGAEPSDRVMELHRACMDIQLQIADRLRPGEIPSRIYADVLDNLPELLQDNFMGFGKRKVKFLGHGVGLHVDDMPVLAKGFDQPLEENMTMAVEPKFGIAGIGMVGTEDTYVVKPGGGECLTGGPRDIVVV